MDGILMFVYYSGKTGNLVPIVSEQYGLSKVRYYAVAAVKRANREAEGRTQGSFIRVGNAPASNRFPFHIPFLQKRYPFGIYLLFTKGTPFTYLVSSTVFLLPEGFLVSVTSIKCVC